LCKHAKKTVAGWCICSSDHPASSAGDITTTWPSSPADRRMALTGHRKTLENSSPARKDRFSWPPPSNKKNYYYYYYHKIAQRCDAAAPSAIARLTTTTATSKWYIYIYIYHGRCMEQRTIYIYINNYNILCIQSGGIYTHEYTSRVQSPQMICSVCSVSVFVRRGRVLVYNNII